MTPRSFLIVDDHALIRVGLCDTLRQAYPGASLLEAADGNELKRRLEQEARVDLVILDLYLKQGGSPDFELLRELCEGSPELKVLVLSASEEPLHVRKALAIGACGYVPKAAPGEELLGAVEEVLGGGTYHPRIESGTGRPHAVLTTRQEEILQRLVEGHSNRRIALELGVAESTVKAHVSAIYQRLGVDNRAQLVAYALNRGLAGGGSG